eukprot:scaffold31306_cov33-Prasinocladus_malaysianus.AAC.3
MARLCLEEAVGLVLRALEDSFHEIKKSGSGLLVQLAQSSPCGSLESAGDPLANALLANCGHQHSKVRHATAEALGTLVVNGVSQGETK